MALAPIDETHALQIQAGTLGRKTGHLFEDTITSQINDFQCLIRIAARQNGHVFTGDPASLLLNYIGKAEILKPSHLWSRFPQVLSQHRKLEKLAFCKWRLALKMQKRHSNYALHSNDGRTITVGFLRSSATTPPQQMLNCTLLQQGGFQLLLSNEIPVSENAILALRQFCGDMGFRPCDNPTIRNRLTDPRRYFWEEINEDGRVEWESILLTRQDDISRLLFQKAYIDDPFTPEYILHKTKASPSWNQTEVAIHTIDEIVSLSRRHQGFTKKSYSVRKGSYKDPAGVI